MRIRWHKLCIYIPLSSWPTVRELNILENIIIVVLIIAIIRAAVVRFDIIFKDFTTVISCLYYGIEYTDSNIILKPILRGVLIIWYQNIFEVNLLESLSNYKV